MRFVWDFVFLLGCWTAFVSKTKIHELWVGLACAVLAVVASVVAWRDTAPLRPSWRQAALIAWEPWYALTGIAALFAAMGDRILGRRSKAELRAVSFEATGDEPRAAAQRTFATLYMTIVPNFIVVGIDRKKKKALIHQVRATGTPVLGQRLGLGE